MAGSRRAVRIANCSGAIADPGIHMYNQAKFGHVDVITGDYLAEANLADSTLPSKAGHPGWIPSALDGITRSLDLINEKRIKIIVNGGGLDPKGLAIEVDKLIKSKKLKLRLAIVEGDDLMHKVHALLASKSIPHLDSANPSVKLEPSTLDFLDPEKDMPIVTANAYLGYRAIKKGLDLGADIVICGRVADASPVMAAAAWWHGWQETDYDELAAALVGGHLIECSTYVTGGNFSGAYERPVSDFVDIGCPIAEIAADGGVVVTKHEALGGFVTEDTVKCQLLYELQGDIYLNSDVKADLSAITVSKTSTQNRVFVTGVRGHPPPPTTKLAVFYRAGFQAEILLNASGYATDHKWDVQEAQVRERLRAWHALDDLEVLDFQRVGVPMEDPDCQLASTTYMRIFAQARQAESVRKVAAAWNYTFMTHFPGMHCSLDLRTALPKAFVAYYPALIPQAEIDESVSVFADNAWKRIIVGPPQKTEPLQPRANYDPSHTTPLSTFGPTTRRPLGDIALARSGDKGANVNIGLFVRAAEEWTWFQSFMTTDRLKQLMGRDWRDEFHVERVEFPGIRAVHFVVYGLLGRGVSSSRLLDSLGKGFAEFIRARHVDIPVKFLGDRAKL